VDNKGVVGLINSWSATGRTHYISTRINFLLELNESGVLVLEWISNLCETTKTTNLSMAELNEREYEHILHHHSVMKGVGTVFASRNNG
jgi:hypothetical protein